MKMTAGRALLRLRQFCFRDGLGLCMLIPETWRTPNEGSLTKRLSAYRSSNLGNAATIGSLSYGYPLPLRLLSVSAFHAAAVD